MEFALHLGTPTRFHYTELWNDRVERLLDTSSTLDPAQETQELPLGHLAPGLGEALQYIQALATLINTHTHSPAMIDGNAFHDVINFLGYRLIAINPLGSPHLHDSMSNMLLLGLYCFVVTFFAGLNRKIPPLPLLGTRLRAAVDKHQVSSVNCHEVLIWTLLISRTVILRPSDDTWILPKIQESIQILGITDSDQLQQRLSKLPWIGVLHNTICNRLFTTVSQRLLMPPLLGI